MVNFKIKSTLASLGVMAIASTAHASIATSPHNLSATPGSGGDICVFCHTPHGSDTSAPAPLWNKLLATDADYTTYDALNTATLDGAINLDAGGISLACLSCHDGVSAMDLVRNAPTTASQTYRFDPNGIIISGGLGVFMANALITDKVPMLSRDLRDDHPVGVQYAGGGLNWANIQAGNNVADSAGDKLFIDPVWTGTRMWIGDPAVIAGDALPLYNGGLTLNGPLVECATCHDPHKTTYTSFLRRANTASGLCLACHVK